MIKKAALAEVRDPTLRHTLGFGIGLHHAGLGDADRALVERLFVAQKIQVGRGRVPFFAVVTRRSSLVTELAFINYDDSNTHHSQTTQKLNRNTPQTTNNKQQKQKPN